MKLHCSIPMLYLRVFEWLFPSPSAVHNNFCWAVWRMFKEVSHTSRQRLKARLSILEALMVKIKFGGYSASG